MFYRATHTHKKENTHIKLLLTIEQPHEVAESHNCLISKEKKHTHTQHNLLNHSTESHFVICVKFCPINNPEEKFIIKFKLAAISHTKEAATSIFFSVYAFDCLKFCSENQLTDLQSIALSAHTLS